MIYKNVRHECNLYNFFFAPRGNRRMVTLGRKIAQMYLNPFDCIIGVIGYKDSGKSMLCRGMFPGLEVIEEDSEYDILDMPLLNTESCGFSTPRTFHVDARLASKYVPLQTIADAIIKVTSERKRVVVEHFELLYPVLKRNADLLIGLGEEVIVTRPSLFGPLPDNIANIVFHSLIYRKMAHSAEDLFGYVVRDIEKPSYVRGDIRHGFLLEYSEKPVNFDLAEIEQKIKDLIAQDLPIRYYDEEHITVGDEILPCTGPLMHVESTGMIENFHLEKDFFYDSKFGYYIVAGTVGHKEEDVSEKLNTIDIPEEL